MLSAIM